MIHTRLLSYLPWYFLAQCGRYFSLVSCQVRPESVEEKHEIAECKHGNNVTNRIAQGIKMLMQKAVIFLSVKGLTCQNGEWHKFQSSL